MQTIESLMLHLRFRLELTQYGICRSIETAIANSAPYRSPETIFHYQKPKNVIQEECDANNREFNVAFAIFPNFSIFLSISPFFPLFLHFSPNFFLFLHFSYYFSIFPPNSQFFFLFLHFSPYWERYRVLLNCNLDFNR